MKKIGALLIFCILVGACFLSGCVDEQNGGPTPSPTTAITLEDAIFILMSEILKPSSSDDRVSAFMMSHILRKGDIIKPESGTSYTLDSHTWFAFIDDDPETFFSHPTRYAFIDAEDGTYNIIDEKWPPLINDYSMWNAVQMNRGNLIEIFPILNFTAPITGEQSSAPAADYGDAPDGQNAYYGVEGRFPTLYATTNSKLSRPGGHSLNVGEETLGVNISAEVDANDPNDPDNVPNLVDSDNDDRMFLILTEQDAKLCFDVTVNETAPDVPRYINVLIDFDQDGNWTDGSYGTEWVVVNEEINVTPGSTETIITSSFSWGNNVDILPSPVWTRVALTREEVNETLFSDIGGWDGSGQFEYGEIEDHIVYLMDNPPEEWPPWPGNPPGGKNPQPPQPPGGQPPGPSEGPCGSDVSYHALIISGGDASKHMKEGQYPAQGAVDTMTELINDQGYNSIGSLGPTGTGSSKNSESNIDAAFEILKSQVKCGDHVLIYIVGHGNEAGDEDGPGINLKGSNGQTDELLTPSDLAGYLGKIKACADENCDKQEVNCHVNVVIESCFAGNFNVPGVTGPGRTVMGSSTDETADASGGGVFTSGFEDASRSEGSDTNDDDVVSPSEAYEKAKGAVESNNKKPSRKKKEAQETWIDSQECECKCPDTPSVTGGKYGWDGAAWADDEITVSMGEIVQFKLEVENDGSTKSILGLTMTDYLPDGLDYVPGSGLLYHNGESLGLRDYCTMIANMEGYHLTWGLTEISSLAPGDTVAIEYSATTTEVGTYTNSYGCSGFCETDPSITVACGSAITVMVV